MQRYQNLFKFLLLTFYVSSASANDLAQMMSDQQLLRAGKVLFQQNCIGCHGVDGKGKGPAAPMLNPKPRNLVAGSFKFRSTPLGSLPTTADLIRTIEQGIPNSSMPAFRFLAPQQKLALAEYIKSLRPDWKEWEEDRYALPAAPSKIFGSKNAIIESAFRGQKLYMEACHTCHGDGGLGNGPNGMELTDSEGQPIKPANLTLRTIKSGSNPEDIFKAIYTGLDGTPMPSFVDVYSSEKIWDLVSYISYLKARKSGQYSAEDKLVAKIEVKGASTDDAAGAEESWD